MSDIEITPTFLPLLREHSLDSFDAVMQRKVERVMRSVPGRATVRLALGDRVVYLKRYEPEYYPLLQRWWHHDEAGHEWKMIHELQRAGFHVPEPVAFGRRSDRSFVMTLEVAGIDAEAKVKQLDAAGRQALLESVAQLTRRFHDAGFIHKDLYLCHIFVTGAELHFIDLQRAIGPGKFAERWRVKDLAALAHSAARIGLPDAGWLQAYGGDEALLRQVAARVAWLNKRRPKYVGVWDDPEKSKARF